MAHQEQIVVVSIQAGADLSAASNKFRMVKLDSAGKVILSTDGALAIGVLQNNPISGAAAEVALFQTGIVKGKAGAALATIGTKLASDSTGRFKAAATGNPIVGVQLTTAGAADEIVEVVCLSPDLST